MSTAFAAAAAIRSLPRYTAPALSRRSGARWIASVSVESARAKIVSENVMVFSTSYCPYCSAVKRLFEGLDVPYTAWELDEMGAEGDDIRAFLMQETGKSTIPQVFVNSTLVGGCDDTMLLHDQGKLMGMIKSRSA